MQQIILSKFIEKFQLTREETEILKQTDVSNEFFLVLEKTHTIHDNCKYLLESGNQVAALSIMEQMSSLQVRNLSRYSDFAILIFIGVIVMYHSGNCYGIPLSMGSNAL